jgi:hypothetical protein
LWASTLRDAAKPVEAVSPDGARVYVTGHTDKGGATVAYDTRTGKQLWARQSTLTAYAATELAVSPDSTTVYVAGVGRKLPFAVIAYAAATGKQRWLRSDTKGGFVDDVALSATGLPSGVGTMSFSPQVVAGVGSSQLTVTTSPTTPGGTYPLTITGTAAGIRHTVTVTLAISARDFTLSVSPSSVTVSRGRSATYTVGVSVVGGSVGVVSMTVAGLPAGTTAVLSPNPAGSPGTSTLTVKTTSSTRRGPTHSGSLARAAPSVTTPWLRLPCVSENSRPS